MNSNSSGQTRHWPLSAAPLVVSTNVLNPATLAIRYYLSAGAYSGTNTAAELNSIRASFGQWQSVPGTGLRFEDAGLLDGEMDVNTSDHTNVVFWAKTSTLVNGGFDDISGILSVTFPRVTLDNLILEADIVLNGVQFQWFTDFNATNQTDQFIESTVLHEIGHFIGLNHSPVGGATMLARGAPGVNTQAGLSSDEIAAARALYPAAGQLSRLGDLQGRVATEEGGVFGACVLAQDNAGNLVSGTVTRPDGRYDLPALPPGNYQIRVSPLDPVSSPTLARLISGLDISPAFANAVTSFLPAADKTVSLAAGITNQLDFFVTRGDPAFRISRIRPVSADSDDLAAFNTPAMIRLGASNLVLGVYSPDFPATGAILRVTGDGLTVGPSHFAADVFPGANPALNLISASIRVADNATPGLRSLAVQQGTNVAYANGFLEILPAFPDNNFDGLDDTFQRRYFPVFTSPDAAPNADPDGDGFVNASEFVAGTNPTNRLSVLKLDRINLTPGGGALVWQSVPGKRYQVMSRPDLGGQPWKPLGAPVAATDATTLIFDASATNAVRFYRILVVP